MVGSGIARRGYGSSVLLLQVRVTLLQLHILLTQKIEVLLDPSQLIYGWAGGEREREKESEGKRGGRGQQGGQIKRERREER